MCLQYCIVITFARAAQESYVFKWKSVQIIDIFRSKNMI